MIGVCRVRSRCRIRSATSKPSMPGIWTSIRISAKSSVEQPAQRLDAGAGPDEVLAQLAQRRLQDEEVVRRVVDHEDVDFRLGLHGLVSGRAGASGCSAYSRAVEPDAQERPELLALHRLGDVVGCAGVEALPAIVLHGLGGQGDDRQLAELRQLADRPRRLVAVHLRHHDVHQDDVDVRRPAEDVQRLPAVLGREHVHPPVLQHAGQGDRCCARRRRRSAPSSGRSPRRTAGPAPPPP